MNSFSHRILAVVVFATLNSLLGAAAFGAHADVLISSDGNTAGTPKLLVGAHDFDDGDSFADIHLFEGELPFVDELLGDDRFSGDEPGMNGAVQTLQPAGYIELPSNLDVSFDFQTMNIGSTSNLFKWNGAGYDPVTGGVTLEANGAVADGSASSSAGGVWSTTSSGGFFHQHRDFDLLDNDGDINTTADVGIYLVSMTARATNFLDSDPFYLVFATDGVDEEDHELAAEFVADYFGVQGVEAEVPSPGSLALLALGAFVAPLRRGMRRS